MSGVGERRQLVFLDLCSGLGGASQPALDRGWTVVRADIEPKFDPDLLVDLTTDVYALRLIREHLRYLGVERPTVLWASSDCREFSKHGLRCFFPNAPEPDLRLAKACAYLKDELKPDYWFHENVWASRKWLNPIFGRPLARPPGHVIWGNMGILFPPTEAHKGKCTGDKRWGPMGHGRKGGTDNHKRQAAVTAQIPYEIGEAICAAVERRQAEA